MPSLIKSLAPDNPICLSMSFHGSDVERAPYELFRNELDKGDSKNNTIPTKVHDNRI